MLTISIIIGVIIFILIIVISIIMILISKYIILLKDDEIKKINDRSSDEFIIMNRYPNLTFRKPSDFDSIITIYREIAALVNAITIQMDILYRNMRCNIFDSDKTFVKGLINYPVPYSVEDNIWFTNRMFIEILENVKSDSNGIEFVWNQYVESFTLPNRVILSILIYKAYNEAWPIPNLLNRDVRINWCKKTNAESPSEKAIKSTLNKFVCTYIIRMYVSKFGSDAFDNCELFNNYHERIWSGKTSGIDTLVQMLTSSDDEGEVNGLINLLRMCDLQNFCNTFIYKMIVPLREHPINNNDPFHDSGCGWSFEHCFDMVTC